MYVQGEQDDFKRQNTKGNERKTKYFLFKVMANVQELTGVQELSERARQRPAGTLFADGHLRGR